MTNAKQFIEVLKKVSKTTSKDATRYHLGGVYVQRLENGNVQFQASDGHCYSNRTEHLPEVNEIMKATGHYWFHWDTIKTLPCKARSLCTIQADSKELILTSDGVTIRSEDMPNRPGFEQIEPRSLIDGTATFVDICFNPDLLDAVREAMRGDNKSNGVVVRVPVIIQKDNTLKHSMGAMLTKHDSGIGVIMPMRM